MFQNCSPSRARLVNDLFESETKNSDRLSSFGCSRAMSDIIVEPQRPVLTMKTGGSMLAPVVPRVDPDCCGRFRCPQRQSPATKEVIAPELASPLCAAAVHSALVEPGDDVFGRGEDRAR